MAAVNIDYGFDEVRSDLQAIGDLAVISTGGIATARGELKAKSNDYEYRLFELVGESAFLMMHSRVEGFLAVLANGFDHTSGRSNASARGMVIERHLSRIAHHIGPLNCVDSDDWKALLVFTRMRNSLVHALGFQNREFERGDYDRLAALGVDILTAIDEPGLKLFRVSLRSVSRLRSTYLSFLRSLEEEVRRASL